MSEARHLCPRLKWTDGLDARLVQLLAAGCTTAQMARALGEGCSRNAVCGRLYRLRQSGVATPRVERVPAAAPGAERVPAAKPGRKQQLAPARLREKTVSVASIALAAVPFAQRGRSCNRKGPVKPLKAAPLAAPDRALKVPLLGLTPRTCRWPIGDPQEPDFGFCGSAPTSGSSYCAFHRETSIRPLRAAKKLPPIPLPNFNGLSR